MTRLILLALVFFYSSLSAQQINLADKLPMNPNVKVGKLKNGLSYYIMKNVEPAKRAQLRLVVKAGSILEDDSQQGLAHFMEHMNFNGTKNFPKNALMNFLEKSGIQFGADLNAYTSFDETVYMLPVPTDTLAKLNKFMSVLADWSANALLDPVEIDKERGVILEESRSGKGAQSRIREKLLPVIFNGSKYASRLPIGIDSIVKTAPYSEFKRFHKDWYRPDLQAVVAVGDFDVAEMEAMIVQHFSKIKKAKKPRARTQYSVPLKGGTEAIIITDKEQPNNLVQLYYLMPEKKTVTGQDKREGMIVSLFNTMINNRLQEKLQIANPPFLYGGSGYGPFLGKLDALTVIAVAKGHEVETALKSVLDENERVRKFGFTNSELERAKQNMKASLTKQFKEKDKSDSENYVEEYVQSFLNDEPSTDEAFDLSFADQFLADIKIEEVNTSFKALIKNENRVLALIGSENDKSKLPTKDQLIKWLDNTGNNVTAYVDEKIESSLVAKLPAAGNIKSTSEIKEIGVTKLSLSNGVNVYLKPTDFKNDEILISAKSYGGSSLYDDAMFDNASFSSRAASLSGSGKMSTTQLKKFMSGKVASVNAYISENSEGISASSSVKDLETAFQMIFNKFTNTNLDTEVVKGALANQRDGMLAMEKTPIPDKVFFDTIQAVTGSYAYRSKSMTSERIGKVDASKAMEIYKERFSNAADFEFTIVGNFEVEKIKPLLLQYIGSLPSNDKIESFKDRNIEAPKGKVTKIVKKGTEKKATVLLLLNGQLVHSQMEELHVGLLSDILAIKLTEKLREQEGGVYSPSVGGNVSKVPKPKYSFSIYFPCSPDNVEKLIAMSMAEIEKLISDGPESGDIEKVIQKKSLDFETALKNNNFWVDKISSLALEKQDLGSILNGAAMLKTVTAASLKAAAAKYLSTPDVLKFILLPEN